MVYISDIDTPLESSTILILPPSDYWAIATTLNVKTPKEALAYAPALFELDESHRYDARKIGENRFVLIAYDPVHLAEKFKALTLPPSIKEFTFAQWVFADAPEAIRLKNGKVLASVEEIVVEIDPAYLRGSSSLSIHDALSTPKPIAQSIPIESLLPTEVTSKTAKATLLVIIIAWLNLLSIFIINTQDSARLDAAKTQLLQQFNLSETSFEREAALNALKNKEAAQRTLRDHIRRIGTVSIYAESMPASTPSPLSPPPSISEGIVLIPGSKPGEANRLLVEGKPSVASTEPIRYAQGIQELTYDGKMVKILINTKDAKATSLLKSEFQKRFKTAKYTERDQQLEVRIK